MRTLLILALTATAFGAEKLKEFKPSRLNLFSQEQDVQLGKESADEVRKTMPMVNNNDIVGYVNRIGARLAKSPRAGGYPYTFEIVNDPEHQRLALPGGPMFVHTGLISSLDNEAQLAGVLAHEMSHVSLRHGTSNVSKANLIQLPAMLAGNMLGSRATPGIAGSAWDRAGSAVRASEVLPHSGTGSRSEWRADHERRWIRSHADGALLPETRRTERRRQQQAWPISCPTIRPPAIASNTSATRTSSCPRSRTANRNRAALPRVKQLVAALPAPPQARGPARVSPPREAEARQSSAGGGQGADPRPSGRYRAHQGPDFQLNYPDNWEVFSDPNSSSVTIAPRATLIQNQQGGVDIAYGMLSSYYFPQDGKGNLQRDTTALIKQLGSSQVRQTANSKSVKVAGQNAFLTPMESQSPYQGQREIDMLLTIARPEALFYIVFISPESEWANTQKTYDAVVASLKFTK